MKRLHRLTALLSFLQSKSFTKLEEIEARFQISQRTIYRDLQALIESGVPILFEKNQGYYLVERHFLAPMSFTLEEAKSFIFVEQLAKKYTDNNTFAHFSNALEKVKNRLKAHQLENVEVLEKSITVYIDERYKQKHLQLVEEACSSRKIIKIAYKDLKNNKTQRTIEPIGMTFYSQNWHVIAFCRLRNDYRDFVLSRIDKIEVTKETMLKKRLNLNEYINKLQNNLND